MLLQLDWEETLVYTVIGLYIYRPIYIWPLNTQKYIFCMHIGECARTCENVHGQLTSNSIIFVKTSYIHAGSEVH